MRGRSTIPGRVARVQGVATGAATIPAGVANGRPWPIPDATTRFLCRPERSEGSPGADRLVREILRCAQDDSYKSRPTYRPGVRARVTNVWSARRAGSGSG